MGATIFPHRAVYGRRLADSRETFFDRLTSALLSVAMSCAAVTAFLIAAWILLREPTPHSISNDESLGDPTEIQIVSEADLLLQPLAVTVPAQPIPEESDRYETLFDVVGKLAINDFPELPDVEHFAFGADSVNGAGDFVRQDGRRTASSRNHAHRWIFVIAAVNTRENYVRLLKELKIDVAVVYADGRAVSVPLSDGQAAISLSVGDSRYFTTWIDGELAELDAELCRAAGVSIDRGTVVHLFDPSTEAYLERIEREFAGREAEAIGRTWFQISQSGSEYVVSVVRQSGIPRP